MKGLVVLAFPFMAAQTASAQDTLSFNGYLATHHFYFTRMELPDGGPTGPDGDCLPIGRSDSVTNLHGICSFLVTRLPNKIFRMDFGMYIPQERTILDPGAGFYTDNDRIIASAHLETGIERTYRCWGEAKAYYTTLSFRKVQVRYVPMGTKRLKVLTEKGIVYKPTTILRILAIKPDQAL